MPRFVRKMFLVTLSDVVVAPLGKGVLLELCGAGRVLVHLDVWTFPRPRAVLCLSRTLGAGRVRSLPAESRIGSSSRELA